MTRTEETGRHARRVLRWLEAGPATIEPAATEGSLILRNGLGVIAATTDLLAQLARDGKILRRGARLEASGAAPASMVPQRTTGTVAAGSRAPAVNPAESPLGLLVRLKDRNGSAFLDAAEFDAGERLREDYTRGRIMPRIGANWEIGVSSGMRGEANTVATLTDAALAARQRVDRALTAVGPELSGLLVVAVGKGRAEDGARRAGAALPAARSAKHKPAAALGSGRLPAAP